jgi:hypothetical protein
VNFKKLWLKVYLILKHARRGKHRAFASGCRIFFPKRFRCCQASKPVRVIEKPEGSHPGHVFVPLLWRRVTSDIKFNKMGRGPLSAWRCLASVGQRRSWEVPVSVIFKLGQNQHCVTFIRPVYVMSLGYKKRQLGTGKETISYTTMSSPFARSKLGL